MLILVLVSGALAMPIRRSLDLGGFGDESLVTTLPTTTTSKTHRNSLIFEYCLSFFIRCIGNFMPRRIFILEYL